MKALNDIPISDSDLALKQLQKIADRIVKIHIGDDPEFQEAFKELFNEKNDPKYKTIEEIHKMFQQKVVEQNKQLLLAKELSVFVQQMMGDVQRAEDVKELTNDIPHAFDLKRAGLDGINTDGAKAKFYADAIKLLKEKDIGH